MILKISLTIKNQKNTMERTARRHGKRRKGEKEEDFGMLYIDSESENLSFVGVFVNEGEYETEELFRT